MHRLKMAACGLARRVLWRWWPHVYVAKLPGYEPPLTVNAGSPRHPDMPMIRQSSLVLECTIVVGRVVQDIQLNSDEADDGTNSG